MSTTRLSSSANKTDDPDSPRMQEFKKKLRERTPIGESLVLFITIETIKLLINYKLFLKMMKIFCKLEMF